MAKMTAVKTDRPDDRDSSFVQRSFATPQDNSLAGLVESATKGAGVWLKAKDTELTKDAYAAASDMVTNVLTGTDDSELPQSLKSEFANFTNMNAATKQGKLSKAQLNQRVMANAATLRRTHIGYEEVIDQAVRATLGQDPRQIVAAEKTRSVTKARDDKEALISFARQNLGFAGSDEEAYKAGQNYRRMESRYNIDKLRLDQLGATAKASKGGGSSGGSGSLTNAQTVVRGQYNLALQSELPVIQTRTDPLIDAYLADPSVNNFEVVRDSLEESISQALDRKLISQKGIYDALLNPDGTVNDKADNPTALIKQMDADFDAFAKDVRSLITGDEKDVANKLGTMGLIKTALTDQNDITKEKMTSIFFKVAPNLARIKTTIGEVAFADQFKDIFNKLNRRGLSQRLAAEDVVGVSDILEKIRGTEGVLAHEMGKLIAHGYDIEGMVDPAQTVEDIKSKTPEDRGYTYDASIINMKAIAKGEELTPKVLAYSSIAFSMAADEVSSDPEKIKMASELVMNQNMYSSLDRLKKEMGEEYAVGVAANMYGVVKKNAMYRIQYLSDNEVNHYTNEASYAIGKEGLVSVHPSLMTILEDSTGANRTKALRLKRFQGEIDELNRTIGGLYKYQQYMNGTDMPEAEFRRITLEGFNFGKKGEEPKYDSFIELGLTRGEFDASKAFIRVGKPMFLQSENEKAGGIDNTDTRVRASLPPESETVSGDEGVVVDLEIDPRTREIEETKASLVKSNEFVVAMIGRATDTELDTIILESNQEELVLKARLEKETRDEAK